MSASQYFGLALIALPFVGIVAAIVKSEGIGEALAIAGVVVLIVVCLVAGAVLLGGAR